MYVLTFGPDLWSFDGQTNSVNSLANSSVCLPPASSEVCRRSTDSRIHTAVHTKTPFESLIQACVSFNTFNRGDRSMILVRCKYISLQKRTSRRLSSLPLDSIDYFYSTWWLWSTFLKPIICMPWILLRWSSGKKCPYTPRSTIPTYTNTIPKHGNDILHPSSYPFGASTNEAAKCESVTKAMDAFPPEVVSSNPRQDVSRPWIIAWIVVFRNDDDDDDEEEVDDRLLIP